MSSTRESVEVYSRRARRSVGLVAFLLFVAFVVVAVVSKPKEASGVKLGRKLPSFAAPLALSALTGDANVATHPDSGEAGRRPACTVRGPAILNICQLYERGPVVLALFVEGGSCPDILNSLQTIAPDFPGVQFAGVSIKGNRTQLRDLVRSRDLTLPVGYDQDGILASLYKMVTCPEVMFAYPGGVVESQPLLNQPSLSTLRSRVAALVAGARAQGWRPASPREGQIQSTRSAAALKGGE
jgi:hypothetical protein